MIQLVKGDSTKADISGLTIRPVNCIITDPPYGVAFESGFAKTEQGKEFTHAIKNDSDIDTAVLTFTQAMWRLTPYLAPEADIYAFTSWEVEHEFRDAMNRIDPGVITVKNMLVWEKGWPGLGDLDANWPNSFELIIYAKKGRRRIPKRSCSVIAIDRVPSGKMIHPTEKPVELLERLIAMSTSPDDLVVDPFAGSASTLLAARNMGRNAIGFEDDEAHYVRALQRLSQGSLFG
jgi:adenine-specific DNA-methyltransferase